MHRSIGVLLLCLSAAVVISACSVAKAAPSAGPVSPGGGQAVPDPVGQPRLTALSSDDLFSVYQGVLVSAVAQVDPSQLIAGARKGAHVAAAQQGMLPIDAAILDTAPLQTSTDAMTTWADFGNAYDVFLQKLGGRIDVGPVGQGAARGMLATLGDPLSTYLDRSAMQSLQVSSDAGIGVVLVPRRGAPPVVREVEPDGPAARAGIHPGDVISAVGGRNTMGLDLYDVLSSLSGQNGSGAILSVASPGNPPRDVTMRRARVRPPSVTTSFVDGLEIIAVRAFDSGSTATVRRALLDSLTTDATGWILDLRGNGEGSLTEAVSMTSLFVGDQVIALDEDHGGARSPVRGSDLRLSSRLPLAVLIDGATAGPGELLAAAIHDYELGTLVGTPTAGRLGTPRLVRLSDGSAAEITTRRVLSPQGTPLLGTGFPADVYVEADPASLGSGVDPVRDRAVNLLNAGPAHDEESVEIGQI